MNLGRYIWGIVVIFIGLVFLLTNFGYVSPAVWSDIWRFWPVILIIVGLSIISKTLSAIARIIINIIIVLLVLGSFATILLYNGEFPSVKTTSSSQSEVFNVDENLAQSAKSISYKIVFGAGNLTVDGASSKALEGVIKTNFLEPIITSENSFDSQDIKVTSKKTASFPIFRGQNEWKLSLNNALPVNLDIDSGASDAKVDLTSVAVKDLQIKSGASSYELSFGDKSELTSGEINIGASLLKIRVPKSVGLKFNMSTGASSNNLQSQGLNRSGDIHKTDGYDSATKKIDLKIKAGAASIELDRL